MTVTSDPKRIVVAINPSARFGTTVAVGPHVVAALRELGHEVTSLAEADFATLLAVATVAVASRPDALVVVGGDGMVNLGTNLVVGTGIPLGIVPSGSGNDMARGLGIPIGDTDAAVAAFIEALGHPTRPIDAVRVTDASGGIRWFACVLSAGFDAIVNERANHLRLPRGKSRYLVALALELATLRPLSYRLELDGVELVTSGMLISVGNNVSLGGGMKVTPDALLDDGFVDVLVVRPLSRLAFLRIFPRVFKGTHLTDPRVTVHRARRVRIEAESVVAYADGERFGPLPVDLEVRPGALLVYAPAVARGASD